MVELRRARLSDVEQESEAVGWKSVRLVDSLGRVSKGVAQLKSGRAVEHQDLRSMVHEVPVVVAIVVAVVIVVVVVGVVVGVGVGVGVEVIAVAVADAVADVACQTQRMISSTNSGFGVLKLLFALYEG